MKKVGFGVAALMIAVFALCVARALMLPAAVKEAPLPPIAVNGDEIARHVGEAIRFKTVSWEQGGTLDAQAFDDLIDWIATTYPAANAAMTREIVNGHSLIYHWQGTDATQKPIGFIGHLDVVPVEPGTEDRWTHPPFSGDIAEGEVWGRGALDNKGPFITLLEAIERLAQSGFRPSRDIYILLGQDEELGGDNGAGKIAEILKARSVHFSWMEDEGAGVVKDLIPGVDAPVALIDVAEKGSATLRLMATAPGGHSSAPGKDTAVSLVSRAVIAVTDHPYPLKFSGDIVAFLHAIAPETSFVERVALANLWLTGPLVKAKLAKDPAAAASMRTTTAATIISGGTKSNVLPQEAEAIVNYRIHPRDSVAGVEARAERLINDKRVMVELLDGREPTPPSPTENEGYAALAASTRAIFGAVPVAPSLMIGGTDSRHYPEISDANFRYLPFTFTPDMLELFHGTNERVRIDTLARASAFYEDLIRRAAS